jgi:NosR/NirI family nitrous oxide reductase transcriptional regulator
LLLWAFTGVALAEQRFPPPDFESGYKLPVTQTPAPRGVVLEYLDVAVLIAALGLACWLVYKKRSRRGVLALSLFSLGYFGFYREGCICAIGSVQNVALALFDRGYALPLMVGAFFLAPLVVSLFAGRTFCAAVCPHGALQDLVLLKPVKVPPWLEQGLGVLAYIYLGAAVLFAATGSAFIICRFDPFVPIFRLSGSFNMLLLGAAFLLAGVFVGRPYCRFLCPYGALLRLGAKVSKWRVTVTPDYCTQCRLCEQSCPYGALQEPTQEPADPRGLFADRKRLGRVLVLVPALILLGGWLGSRLSTAASRVDPTVALAERFVSEKPAEYKVGSQIAEDLALNRAQQNPKEILVAAASIRHRLGVGGWVFGGWVGLVIGWKLLGLSLRRTRTDYEPDRGACLACARCFEYCPNERARLQQS